MFKSRKCLHSQGQLTRTRTIADTTEAESANAASDSHQKLSKCQSRQAQECTYSDGSIAKRSEVEYSYANIVHSRVERWIFLVNDPHKIWMRWCENHPITNQLRSSIVSKTHTHTATPKGFGWFDSSWGWRLWGWVNFGSSEQYNLECNIWQSM